VTTFPDRKTSAAGKAEHDALLRAAVQTGRTLAGGVTHDLNSALQILGDSLYAIRDDTQTLMRESPRTSGDATASLAASLKLADDAFDRISAITRVVPNLVVASGDDSGPILVEAELRAVVALTRHHWKNRLAVSVEIPTPIPQFRCRWWIARLAAMRMVMLAAESHQRSPNNFNAERLPVLRLSGVVDGDRFALQMILERSGDQSEITTTDSVVELCAKCLSGEVITAATSSGASLTTLQYPVRLSAAPSESGCV
jgi:hypothetical protein